jgi:hypothetical protein
MSSYFVSKEFSRAARVAVVSAAVTVGCGGPESLHPPRGSTGAAGFSVLPVKTGDAGTSGMAGVSGAAGDLGAAGTTGAAGLDISGTAGATAGAPSGAAGAGTAGTGAAGATGVAGTTGTTGSAGTTGVAGAGGRAGTNGAAGTSGAAGAPGARDAGVEAAPEAPPLQAYASTGWVPNASITAAGNADQPANAFDGKLGTRWTTGRNQMGDESFTVDLGASKPVSRVVLDDSTNPMDFPAAYTLEVSTTNAMFTVVKMGAGATVTDIRFPTVMARYLRLHETGKTPMSWWSIDELRVYP